MNIPNLHPASSRRKDIMLCVPFEERRLEKWKTKNLVVQPKLNGERCRALIDCSEKKVTLFSSEANIITSVPHIEESLLDFTTTMQGRYLELDGELYSHGMPLEEIHSIVSTKNHFHPDHEEIEYHVFDHVSVRSTLVRMSELWDLFDFGKPNLFKSIKRVPFVLASDLPEIMYHFEKITSEGYEGIVVRHPMSPYERKRSLYVMKFKPHQEDIYRIVGFKEEVDKYGTPKNRLGSFLCASEDSTFTFSVGSGLTVEQRIAYWEMKDSLPGSYLRVKYQTKSKKSCPLFPIFVELVTPTMFIN